MVERGEGRRNQRSHLCLDRTGEWTEFAGGVGGELCVLSGKARALFQQRVWEAFGNSVWGLRDYETSVCPKQS